jgi:hypothetical protein
MRKTNRAWGAEAGKVAGGALPLGRRLSDKILAAFNQACEQGELETAQRLLGALEILLAGEAARCGEVERRRDAEGLVAAYERLWYLRHPGGGAEEGAARDARRLAPADA